MREHGVTQAQYNSGLLLYHGEGVTANKSRAARSFKLSAEEGYGQAQYNYGLSLCQSEGTAMNKSHAGMHFKFSGRWN
jgi:TPR repeat protein